MTGVRVVGVTHRTAPVRVRETFALDAGGRAAAARRFLQLPGVREVVVLSTCNRTEVFVAGPLGAEEEQPGSHEALTRALLASRCAASDGDASECCDAVRVISGREALRHALALPAGLESMVLGETQILAQVRRAYREAVERGFVGPVFRRLFPCAFKVAKRAHTETALSQGAASVGSMAVELATKVFGDLEDRTALLVGAGDTGRTIAKALRDRRIGRLWICGRTRTRADELAAALGGSALEREEAWSRLAHVDVLLLAARPEADEWVVRADTVREAVRERDGRPLLIVDVGVPRNAEPAVRRVRNVFLYTIDDLETFTRRTLARRRRAAREAWDFVDRELERFEKWWTGAADVGGVLRRFHRRLEEIRERELRRTLKKLPPEAHEAVERFSRILLDKVVQGPARRLREGDEKVTERAESLAWLFDLDPGTEVARGGNGAPGAGADNEEAR